MVASWGAQVEELPTDIMLVFNCRFAKWPSTHYLGLTMMMMILGVCIIIIIIIIIIIFLNWYGLR